MNRASLYDAAILGGGIAGCSAAIHLAARGHRVILFEQKRYPVNKLCGEFLSVEASGYLEKLGVLSTLESAGATRIRHMKLIARSGHIATGNLPGIALGVSRYVLDNALIERASELGAECLQGMHVRSVSGRLGSFNVEASDGRTFHSQTVVMAYGKRSEFAKRKETSDKHVAFKAHFQGAFMQDTIEMFSFAGGYVGLSAIENGLTNACFISTAAALQQAGGKVDDFIRSASKQSAPLRDRLGGLTQCVKTIGVSNFSFAIHGAINGDKLNIGDAAAMIAPLCGDGMSMAMRSAQIAAHGLDDYLNGHTGAEALKSSYAAAWTNEFLLRLKLGQVLQRVAENSFAADLAIQACATLPKVADLLIALTRGKAADFDPSRQLS